MMDFFSIFCYIEDLFYTFPTIFENYSKSSAENICSKMQLSGMCPRTISKEILSSNAFLVEKMG